MWGEEEDDRRERERRARFGYNHAENGELLNAARRTICTDRTCSVIPKNWTNKDNNKKPTGPTFQPQTKKCENSSFLSLAFKLISQIYQIGKGG
jgi:hypothetical protein